MTHGFPHKISVFVGFLLCGLALVQTVEGASLFSAEPAGARLEGKGKKIVQYDEEGQGYRLQYQDKEHVIEYWVNLRGSLLQNGLLTIRVSMDKSHISIPIYECGVMVRNSTGEIVLPGRVPLKGGTQMVGHSIKNGQIRFEYKEKFEGKEFGKTYILSLVGTALRIHVQTTPPQDADVYYAGFDFGRTRYNTNPKLYQLPFSPIPCFSAANKFFLSTYVDPFLSNTGTYSYTAKMHENNAIQASNSPALLNVAPGETPPALNVVAYLTASPRMTDVLPQPVSEETPFEYELRKRTVLDLHELPMAQWPYQPIQTIRRWEAPDTGKVSLRGSFALNGPEPANVEVRLVKADSGDSHVLFSQALDAAAKPKTAIEGDFPMYRGDRLEFAVSGPAVMSGGEVPSSIQLEQNDIDYDSANDFGGEQGANGWYYEQAIGNERTLMLWKPELKQWQSPLNRSYQTAEAIVNRSGQIGDGYKNAERFLDELSAFGLMNRALVLQDWSRHTGSSVNRDSDAWGPAASLQELTQVEQSVGNPVVHGLSIPNVSETTEGEQTQWDHVPNLLREDAAAASNVMNYNGLYLDLSNVTTAFEDNLKDATASALSKRLFHSFASIAGAVQGVPPGRKGLLLHGDEKTRHALPYLASLTDGIFPFVIETSNVFGAVDEDIRNGRRISPRIGFDMNSGSEHKKQDAAFIDPRFFPWNEDSTSTVIYARVPYISGRIWSPEMNTDAIRRWFIEKYAILNPVAREYLDPRNEVVGISYLDAQGNPLSLEEALFQDKLEKNLRMEIRYANGLVLFANRTEEVWNPSEHPNSNVSIDANGFMAFNEISGLFSVIGAMADSRFTASYTRDSYFLHSRDGGFVRFQNYATDGLMTAWKSGNLGQMNYACQNSTEIAAAPSLDPILRANARVSCSLRWISANQVSLWVLDSKSDRPMLELFNLPGDWFNADNALRVERIDAQGKTVESDVKWNVTRASGRMGIRLPNLQPGEVYTITRGAAL